MEIEENPQMIEPGHRSFKEQRADTIKEQLTNAIYGSVHEVCSYYADKKASQDVKTAKIRMAASEVADNILKITTDVDIIAEVLLNWDEVIEGGQYCFDLASALLVKAKFSNIDHIKFIYRLMCAASDQVGSIQSAERALFKKLESQSLKRPLWKPRILSIQEKVAGENQRLVDDKGKMIHTICMIMCRTIDTMLVDFKSPEYCKMVDLFDNKDNVPNDIIRTRVCLKAAFLNAVRCSKKKKLPLPDLIYLGQMFLLLEADKALSDGALQIANRNSELSDKDREAFNAKYGARHYILTHLKELGYPLDLKAAYSHAITLRLGEMISGLNHPSAEEMNLSLGEDHLERLRIGSFEEAQTIAQIAFDTITKTSPA